MTKVVLLDNPKALVKSHDVQTREVVFSESFKAFAKHWGFTPRACAPYRARTEAFRRGRTLDLNRPNFHRSRVCCRPNLPR